MIPTRYDYYKARSREHRILAHAADSPEQQAMHERLVASYGELARKYRLKQVVTLRRPLAWHGSTTA